MLWKRFFVVAIVDNSVKSNEALEILIQTPMRVFIDTEYGGAYDDDFQQFPEGMGAL